MIGQLPTNHRGPDCKGFSRICLPKELCYAEVILGIAKVCSV